MRCAEELVVWTKAAMQRLPLTEYTYQEIKRSDGSVEHEWSSKDDVLRIVWKPTDGKPK